VQFHAVQLPGGKGDGERFAAGEQVLLPDHFGQRARPQAFGQRRRWRVLGTLTLHHRTRPGKRRLARRAVDLPESVTSCTDSACFRAYRSRTASGNSEEVRRSSDWGVRLGSKHCKTASTNWR